MHLVRALSFSANEEKTLPLVLAQRTKKLNIFPKGIFAVLLLDRF